jgi:hypothetical protein
VQRREKWRLDAGYTRAVVRVGLLVFLLLVAAPAWAHGEQLLVVFGLILYIFPALVLLFLPWHTWRTRFLTVSVLAVCVVVLWSTVLPGIGGVKMSLVAQWSLLLSPSLLACGLAMLLRTLVKRDAA